MTKLAKYLLFSFIVSWVMWGVLALTTIITDIRYGHPIFMTLFIIGGLGPTIGALLSMHPRKDKFEYMSFIKQIFKAKVNVLWYLFVIIVPFVLFSIPFVINIYTVRTGTQLFSKPIYYLIPAIVSNILFGGLEEIGWRGVLLPQLMKKFPIIISTIFTSLIWSLWHLPLWFINSLPQQNMNPFIFIILGLCFSLILTVIYSKTKSIFLCIITHSLFNSYSGIITMPFTNVLLELILMLVFSLVIYLIFERLKQHTIKEESL
ncbi:MAG: type II CAAX prenyl endopeptidase Rce1 family protein [Caulobacteraceae bacterium]